VGGVGWPQAQLAGSLMVAGATGGRGRVPKSRVWTTVRVGSPPARLCRDDEISRVAVLALGPHPTSPCLVQRMVAGRRT
jgi:hypothetical protein